MNMPIKGFFYNNQKKEQLGSDGLFVCDGRLSKASVIQEAKRQAKSYDKHFPHYKITYVRLFRGSILNPSFYTDYIYLR
jgi:hypothetical protein